MDPRKWTRDPSTRNLQYRGEALAGADAAVSSPALSVPPPVARTVPSWASTSIVVERALSLTLAMRHSMEFCPSATSGGVNRDVKNVTSAAAPATQPSPSKSVRAPIRFKVIRFSFLYRAPGSTVGWSQAAPCARVKLPRSHSSAKRPPSGVHLNAGRYNNESSKQAQANISTCMAGTEVPHRKPLTCLDSQVVSRG
jgi:hypothetical protein